jgi:hypothetical protein
MMSIYSGNAAVAFDRVKDEAYWDGWRNFLLRRPNELLSFTAVKKTLNLQAPRYMGIMEIELDAIVGSVGRFNEFSRTFKPTRQFTKERWRRVAEFYYQQGFNPIRVFKVSHVYFVTDGNHRVSVSRAMNLKTISAYVFEFETPVSINTEDDLLSIRRKWQAVQSGLVPVEEKTKTSYYPGALLALLVGAALIGTVPIFVRFSDLGRHSAPQYL